MDFNNEDRKTEAEEKRQEEERRKEELQREKELEEERERKRKSLQRELEAEEQRLRNMRRMQEEMANLNESINSCINTVSNSIMSVGLNRKYSQMRDSNNITFYRSNQAVDSAIAETEGKISKLSEEEAEKNKTEEQTTE